LPPQERRRAVARLEKLRNGIGLIDKQLDALRSSELDKELMNSLRASNEAMKRAGIGIGVEDAEKVMNELDDQIRDASELTITMATPLADAVGPGMMMSDLDDELSRELDEELGLLEHGATADPQPLSGASRTPLPPIPEASAGAQAMSDEEPARPQSRAPVPVSTMQEDW
jgi:hypothetical protein